MWKVLADGHQCVSLNTYARKIGLLGASTTANKTEVPDADRVVQICPRRADHLDGFFELINQLRTSWLTWGLVYLQ